MLVPPRFGDPFVSLSCGPHRFLPPAAFLPARGLAGDSQIWPGSHTIMTRSKSVLACFYILQLLIQQAFRLLSFHLKHPRDVSLYYGSVVPAAAPRWFSFFFFLIIE